MLVTPQINRRNRRNALLTAAISAILISAVGFTGHPWLWLTAGGSGGGYIYWLCRRKCIHRMHLMSVPFPAAWEAILASRVAFYRALNPVEQARFRQLVQVFLGEVRVTGIRTDIDDTVRLLVAASAVIPIFGFHDWDYHRLGEVLVYPDAFNDQYQTDGDERNLLGLTGLASLSGVMILSKPALLAGYRDDSRPENLGIHEFAHLVEQEAESHGLPSEVPRAAIQEWVAFVARELADPQAGRAHINQYGYTNEHEFFAVLTEYFFNSPARLQSRDPALYDMLRHLFHQDPASIFSRTS